jgi:aminopeptidase-like protein
LIQFKNEIEDYFDRLWPICRSITGNGLRESFKILSEIIPLNIHEIESGSKVFDWEVPDEWNIKDAYIITPDGKKIADFKTNNLHVVGYSVPVDMEVSFEELDKHLHYKKELPDAIPYVTSYYKRNWGFCIDYRTYDSLPREGKYKVKIDSILEKGSLTYGELILEGDSKDQILFSSYLCHPSMANNELSGPLALAFLYRELSRQKKRRYSYRFVIAPETIGTICFLHQNKEEMLESVKAGYVFTCCGDDGPVTFKSTREENSLTNRITKHILSQKKEGFRIIPFDPTGSDERQYGSPGFNLQIGVLMRTPFSQFLEYHTSLDNKDLMNFKKLESFIKTCVDFVKAFEINDTYENQIKYCEPFLGKRDLYEDLSIKRTHSDVLKMRMRLLNFLDGSRDLLSICDKYGYSILEVENEILQLKKNGLLK